MNASATVHIFLMPNLLQEEPDVCSHLLRRVQSTVQLGMSGRGISVCASAGQACGPWCRRLACDTYRYMYI